MAVSQMQRAQIFAHSSHRAALIKDLQNLEIIHIINLNEQEDSTSEAESEAVNEVRAIVRGMQNDLSLLQSTIGYLARFEQKKGFIAGLLGSQVVFSSQDYSNITTQVAHGDWRAICNECQSLETQVLNLTSRESRLRSDRENLLLWSDLDVPIERIQDTEKTAIRIGVIPLAAYDSLRAEIGSSEVDVAFEVVGQTKTELYLVVIFLKEDEQEITPLRTR